MLKINLKVIFRFGVLALFLGLSLSAISLISLIPLVFERGALFQTF
jgi:hypothetical protein